MDQQLKSFSMENNGETSIFWFANLFNKILRSKKMPNDWRKGTLVPIHNYKGIELMAHMMALWEGLTKF